MQNPELLKSEQLKSEFVKKISTKGKSLKRLKSQKSAVKSQLLVELEKIAGESIDKKKQLIVKYLSKQEDVDVERKIKEIKNQGLSIPLLEIALSLCEYDKQVLQQLLKGQVNQNSTSAHFSSSKNNSDPFLNLLSDSEIAKRPKAHNQPSFLEYKNISLSKKNELIDFKKGKLKSKAKDKLKHSLVYPTELEELKSELYKLPSLSNFQKSSSFIHNRSDNYAKSLKQLSSSFKETQSLQKKHAKFSQEETELQKVLNTALDKRAKTTVERNIKGSTKTLTLPQLQSTIKKRFNTSPEISFQMSGRSQQKRISKQTFKLSETGQKIIRSSADGLFSGSEIPQSNLSSGSKISIHKQKYWPQYAKYSSYNKKQLQDNLSKLQKKMHSITEMHQIPNEETLEMYFSLKNIEQNDERKMRNQSISQEKTFSNTKYKIKYRFMKDSYREKVKQHINEKKMRNFEKKKHDSDENNNLNFRSLNLNVKMLEKLNARQ